MATIEKRGPYQYRVKIRRRGQTVTQTFESHQAAQEWALEQEGKIVGGTYVDRRLSQKTTLAEACDFFEKNGLKPNIPDAKNQRSKLRYWRSSRFANWSISALKPLDLIAWRRALLDEENADHDSGLWAGPNAECSVQTVIHRLNVLSYVYEFWRTHKDGNLPNPAIAKGVRPRTPESRDRRLEPGEEKKLLRTLKEAKKYPWLRPAFIIAVETAIRQAELAGLPWRRVELNGKEPHLSLPATATKNSRPRTVPLSKRAVEAFRTLMPAGGAPPLAGVLPVETADSIGRAWREVVKQEEHPDLHWHDLRHEATSRLFENTDLRDQEIMDITGHVDPRMLKRYTHLRTKRHASRLNGRRAA